MRSRGFLSSWSPLFLSHGGERHLAIESPNNKAPRVRVNRQIRISPIRVIAPDGEQLGVLSIETAFHGRRERFLDAQHAQLLAIGRVEHRGSARGGRGTRSRSGRG